MARVHSRCVGDATRIFTLILLCLWSRVPHIRGRAHGHLRGGLAPPGRGPSPWLYRLRGGEESSLFDVSAQTESLRAKREIVGQDVSNSCASLEDSVAPGSFGDLISWNNSEPSDVSDSPTSSLSDAERMQFAKECDHNRDKVQETVANEDPNENVEKKRLEGEDEERVYHIDGQAGGGTSADDPYDSHGDGAHASNDGEIGGNPPNFDSSIDPSDLPDKNEAGVRNVSARDMPALRVVQSSLEQSIHQDLMEGGLGTGKQPIHGQEWDDAGQHRRDGVAESRSETLDRDLGQGHVSDRPSGGCRVKRKGRKERGTVEQVQEKKRRRKQGS